MNDKKDLKKKPGRPAKSAEAKPAPAPKVEIKEGLVSKNELWKVVDKRDDKWIISPTAKHVNASGRMPVSEEQLKELFEV